MLTDDDQALIERDRALPGLAILLDDEAFAEALERAGVEVDTLVSRYARYKPGTSCLVAYSSASGPFSVHATTLASHLAGKFQKARARGRSNANTFNPSPGRTHVYLEEAQALVSFFPFDRDLPSLARLYDENQRRHLIERIFRDLHPKPTGVFETLAYKPGRRFVTRLRSSTTQDYVLRFFATPRQARAARRSRSIRASDPLRLPTLVGGSKRHRVTAAEWLEGRPLRDLLRKGDESALVGIEACAEALSELHRVRVPRWDAASLTNGFDAIERGLSALDSRLTSKASEVRREIESRLRAVPTTTAVIHGDFYDKQIVIGSGGPGLVDLDDLRAGDPREDLALCIAHWDRDQLVGDLGSEVDRFAAALFEAYTKVNPIAAAWKMETLDPFVGAALFRLAHHPFRSRRRGWAETIGLILDRSLEWVEGRAR